MNLLKTAIRTEETNTNTLYETYIAEAKGGKGTRLLGKDPVYDKERQKQDTSLAALNPLKKTIQKN
nr:hypothetical protein [Polaribacter sp. IC073]